MLCTDPYVPDPTLVPLERVLAESDILFVAHAARGLPRAAAAAGKRVSTSGRLRRQCLSGTTASLVTRDVKILVTGSAGFIAGYLVQQLLEAGHDVVGLDNFSKYGAVERSYQDHPGYRFVDGRRQGRRADEGARSPTATTSSPARRASAASPTSTSTPTTCWPRTSGSPPPPSTPPSHAHQARTACRRSRCSRSSMVYENATVFPSPEGHERQCPPPTSTYGFQKLACEYFAQRRLGAVPAAVHDLPAVQLRRRRREPRARRQGYPQRQHQAGDEPRGARPGAEDPQGAGPAAHPRRRQPGALLHLRRRPRAGHPRRHVPSGGATTRTSTSRRPPRPPCSSWPS